MKKGGEELGRSTVLEHLLGGQHYLPRKLSVIRVSLFNNFNPCKTVIPLTILPPKLYL